MRIEELLQLLECLYLLPPLTLEEVIIWVCPLHRKERGWFHVDPINLVPEVVGVPTHDAYLQLTRLLGLILMQHPIQVAGLRYVRIPQEQLHAHAHVRWVVQHNHGVEVHVIELD
jgi:hypothetical protein